MSASASAIIEPHHIVFAYCDAFYGKALRRDLHETPVALRKKFFRKLTSGREPFPVAREHLISFLDRLSDELSDRLRKHSPYFWLFLYRRIKPILSPHHEDQTDSHTTLLVRSIVELSLFKFGDLNHSEFDKRSKVPFAKQWGGFLKLAIEQGGGEKRDEIVSLLTSESQRDSLIPVEFRPADYRAIYAAEGLAYEYWLCTARLRSTGKGRRLWFDPTTGEFAYEPDPDTAEAIRRFDDRLKGVTFFPTLVGISTPLHAGDHLNQIFSAQYNVANVDLTDLFQALDFPAKSRDGGNLANFTPSLLSVDEFVDQHKYATEAFRSTVGFRLEPFLYVLWAVSNLALIPNSYLASGADFGLLMFNLLRRGYAIYETDALSTVVKTRIEMRADLNSSVKDQAIEIIDAALNFITLSADLQNKISPWSGGPRPILIKHQQSWVIDTVGIFEFIRRMFTGVHDDGTARGTIFEATVRSSVDKIQASSGIQLGPRKIYKDGQLIDEIDLMVRKHRTVFVCECFSMWMPLNFEIGDPNTIDARTAKIDEKIDQAMETCRFLSKNPTGANYDYSDVEEFIPIVISPFVEWLPKPNDRYWISKTVPRVMAIDELIQFFEPSESREN